MSSNHAKEINRWPKLAESYKRTMTKAFPRMIERKKEKGIAITWKNADDWFNWWTSKPVAKENPDQTVIFE
jgi:hypothetical protein